MRMSTFVIGIVLGLLSSPAIASDQAISTNANPYLQQLETVRTAPAQSALL